jgi:hypothetical protein
VTPVVPGGYLFFTANEAAVVDAFVDRLIPTDELGSGAEDACVMLRAAGSLPIRRIAASCPVE